MVLAFFASTELMGAGRSAILQGLNLIFAFATVTGLFYLALRRLPLKRPAWRPSLLVSSLAALTWAVLFYGFGLFFRVEKYQSVYGALGGVVFVLIGAFFACLTFYFWAQFLYALGKVDIAALERLFLGDSGTSGGGKLDSLVFARSNRLLAKYGRSFAAGETLIEEGDASRDAYYLHTGKVAVFKHFPDGEKCLVEIEAGNLLGEMAYLLNEPRTASVRAETAVTALILSPALLEELMRYSAPLSRRIIDSLAQRLMQMNRTA